MDCQFPSSITAGLTFDRLVTLTAYPANDGWALRAVLRGPAVINLVATAEGVQHRFHADATTTAGWAPGLYSFSIRAEKAGDVFETDAGTLEILPDLANVAAGHDPRSHARKVLAAIEAILEDRATLDQERYRINNRELYRIPRAELLKMRSQYRAEVRMEEAAQCGKSLFGGVVRVRLQ